MTTSPEIECKDDAEGAALRDRREREGKCLSCGATTHKYMFTKSGPFGFRKKMKKVPLTLAGQCKDGRCLICNPLVQQVQMAENLLVCPMKETSEETDLLGANDPLQVVSESVLVIGEDIIIEGCEGMDPEEVEKIVAEEVERILAEAQNEGSNGLDDNISQAIDGLPLEIQIGGSQTEGDCCTKDSSARAHANHPVDDPVLVQEHQPDISRNIESHFPDLTQNNQPEITQNIERHSVDFPDFVQDQPEITKFSRASEVLPTEIPLSIEVPSPSSGEHKRSESAPAIFEERQNGIFTRSADGENRGPPPNQHYRVMSENDLDAWDNGSLDYTCGDTYADFAPALVTVSDGYEEETKVGSGPSLPSREVLDEIHGLARSFDHRMAHRHLVKLRTLSIQYQRRVEISKAGGIQAIISSLKRFGKDSKSTAKQAFAALQNLASIDTIARSIAQNKGISAIVEAMEMHYKCPGVQEHGCAALRNLTSSNVANRTQVGEAGGIRTIIGAMRYHADSAKICDKAVAALGNLSLKHPENRRTIGKEGGIAAILHAMRRHDGHEGVSEKGMHALWDLAHNVLNVELLRAEEGVTDFVLGVGVRFPRRCKEKAVQIYLKL